MALLDNKVVLVTGAASGIGRAAATLFAIEGARVAVCDVDRRGGQMTVQKIVDDGGDAIFVPCDVSSVAETEAMVRTIQENYGRLDGAFNNAGIEGPAGLTADYQESDWDSVISINLKGVWLCMKAQIRAMAGTGGSIVNTSSALGKVGITNLPAYVASKHGVIGITRAAALDHADSRVRINAVAPGVIDTPLMQRRIEEMPEIEAPLLAAHPIGRLGKTGEIAEAVAWLLSDRSSFVHGEVLSVDGGYLAV